jgi:glycyl-tRNA synthetase alpha subunit
MTFREQQTAIYLLVKGYPGRSQREIGEALFGPGTRQQKVNQAVKMLAAHDVIEERRRTDGRYGYWPHRLTR